MKINRIKSYLVFLSLFVLLVGCGQASKEKSTANESDSLETIIEKAKEEGKIQLSECQIRGRTGWKLGIELEQSIG